MANFDLVFPYATHWEQWLEEQGYLRPAVRQGNLLPTTSDLNWALGCYPLLDIDDRWSSQDALTVVERGKPGYVLFIEGFDRNDDAARPKHEVFTMRGNPQWEVTLLVKLSERCGQLVLYPDTGCPAIILDSGSDPQRMASVWQEACRHDDSWSYLHEQLYR